MQNSIIVVRKQLAVGFLENLIEEAKEQWSLPEFNVCKRSVIEENWSS